MTFRSKPGHMIDLIFPISLFFVFAASSLAVLLLAANLYGTTTEDIQTNDENRTTLSYISGKVRQNDRGGALSITRVEDTDCLTITEDYDGVLCTTYIYQYDGMLMELFFKEGIAVSLKNGKPVMELRSLSMDEPEAHLFRFTATDEKGREDSLTISERSTS